MTRRRLLLALGAALCLLLAAAVALLANDVHAWQTTLRSADAEAVVDRAKAVPSGAGEVLPLHVARSLLGVDDDLGLRRTLLLFRRAYTGIPSHDQSTAGTELRAQAEVALGRLIRDESDASRASAAANLLGVLAFVDSLPGASQTSTPVDRSIVEFQNAIRLDRGNDDAKANLELALGVVPPESPFHTSRHGAQGKRRGGASLSNPGRGY